MKKPEYTQEELIAEIQKALLNWYEFKPGSRILYIGKEEEIYPRMLRELPLEVVSAPMEAAGSEEWQKEQMGAFDYVVAVEVLEIHPDPVQALKEWKRLLRPSGILLLAVNNRYGLRYFCGDRDPYTQRNFDGIEGYRRAYASREDGFSGRCYSREELKEMAEAAGWPKMQFFSVLSGLDEPRLIYREDYLPNEDLSNRLFPTYHYPGTVFLEEECLYGDLIKNGMFHQMANAYLVECAMEGELCDVCHVTSSMERGRQDALITIIRESGIVEKRAPYHEGKTRLKKMLKHGDELKAHGIRVVDAKLEGDNYVMPYVMEESGQLYLKRLLHTDQNRFVEEMDHFRDLILASSDLIEPDRGDGEGAILKKGYLDMVPLNSFHGKDTFLFYDQEFCEEDYPANALIWRMIATFYSGDLEAKKFFPMEGLLERYGLTKRLEKWQRMEWDFLTGLRKEKELRHYHEKRRRNGETVNGNRQRMNYSSDEYQRLFIDIFRNADTRKLILFGSGNFTRKFLSLYRSDYPVHAIVDNDMEKWGTQMEGIPICPPKMLEGLQSGEYKVLVCVKNCLSVMKQLDGMGIREYSVYDSGKDYPRKRKPTVQGQGEAEERKEKKKYHTGYIAGVFDLFHVGHLNMFKRAKEQCEYLIVGVVTDEGVRAFKKTETFIPFEERIEMVRSCRFVDEAVEIPFRYGGTRDAYRLYHFDCQFSGSDYADHPDWLGEKEFLEQQGAEMVFFPYTEGTSSSRIKALIEKKLV